MDGRVFTWVCDASGFVMTETRTGQRVHFGVRGDALMPGDGAGSWCMANGGFGAQCGDRRIAFPRQEPFCPGTCYLDYSPLCEPPP